MGLWDIAKEQFLDVIEFEDKSNKLIVTKYRRENGDDELKQGSKVIVNATSKTCSRMWEKCYFFI